MSNKYNYFHDKNTIEFTPTEDYHLVPKKYVDDLFASVNTNGDSASSGYYDDTIDLQYQPFTPCLEDGTFDSYLPTEMGRIKRWQIINGVMSGPIFGELIAIDDSASEKWAQIIRMYQPPTYNPDTEPNYAYTEWQRVISDVTGERVYGAWNQTFPIEIPETIEVDTELSTTSENPVQNKIITNAINNHVANTNNPHIEVIPMYQLNNGYSIEDFLSSGYLDDYYIDPFIGLDHNHQIKKYIGSVKRSDYINLNYELIVDASSEDFGGLSFAVSQLVTSGDRRYYRHGRATLSDDVSTGVATWGEWKRLDVIVDSALNETSENPVQNKVVATEINDVKTALDGKAPTSHTSSSTMYGVGTSSSYGHLKVADNLTTTTSGTALSANQGKVLNDFITKIKNNTILIKNSNGGFAAGTQSTTKSGGALGLLSSSTSGCAVGYNAKETLGGGAAGSGASSTSGCAVGTEAKETSGGGASGYRANVTSGGAVGFNATATIGGAVGDTATTTDGGAVGYKANAKSGGAVGRGAVAGHGFSGGYNAKCATVDDSVINAVQLGQGTNSTAKTLQVYDYQLMDASGNIPAERLANVPQIIVEDNLTSTSSANALSAAQGKVLKAEIDELVTSIEEKANSDLSNLSDASTALANLGLTATATEINYTDGVTSNIQTQLNNKASSSHIQPASTITSGTFSSTSIKAATGTDYTTARIRNIQASTTDLTAGISALSNGDIYFVYE